MFLMYTVKVMKIPKGIISFIIIIINSNMYYVVLVDKYVN